MLSLKSQISVLDNFVIREESISPVLAMMSKESVEHQLNVSDGSIKEVSFGNFTFLVELRLNCESFSLGFSESIGKI